MMSEMSKRAFLAALAAWGFNATLPAGAQDFPSRPVTIVVPFPVGGPTDTIARIIADHMRASLGQPCTIENVGGAGASIGVGRVARAAPDGYTLVFSNTSAQVMNAVTYTLQYDVVRDFEPVALAVQQSLIVVAKKAFPADNLKELIAWLKAHPGRGLAATAGVGTPQHVTGVQLENLTGTQFQFVSYRGAAPAMQDMIAGQVDFAVESPVIVLPQLRTGTIKAFAVTSKERSPAAPEIPTVDEAGLPGFYYSDWFAFFAPKGVSADIIAKLNRAVVAALADPAVRQRISDLGMEIPPVAMQTPAALAAQQKADVEKWWPIIKAAGIRAE